VLLISVLNALCPYFEENNISELVVFYHVVARLSSTVLGMSFDDICNKRSFFLLTPLTPPKLGCHPQHDTKDAGTKICKCSSEINMKSASAQIILM
jgi:hypothetical protein